MLKCLHMIWKKEELFIGASRFVMKCYYAHCISDYHTNKSRSHIKYLKQLGFEVIDPSSKKYEKCVKKMREEGKTGKQVMDYFVEIVKTCDLLAFAVATTNKISAGVKKEIDTMREMEKPVIQMPEFNSLETMTIEETREYIKSRSNKYKPTD